MNKEASDAQERLARAFDLILRAAARAEKQTEAEPNKEAQDGL